MHCPTCKQELEPGVRFCPHDGTPLTETTSAVPTLTPPERTSNGQPLAKQERELPIVVGGRYRLLELRGGGGMAKVYRAIDVTLEREVAVKLINLELRHESEFDTRFQREARIASQLNDPHIVVVHDFGIDAEHGPFLVMEYLHGQSLAERLQSGGRLAYHAGLQVSAQLLLALIHAHGKDIVHRDIKPENIFLLNQSGVRQHVRVLDFGIARIYRRGEANAADKLTNPGAVLGTPRYMSPEQLAGQTVDARSDLYSAALVMHEALTGHLPYVSGKKLCELCPEAPTMLQDLLDRCLKPNPAERPGSAVEVYLRLQELGKASGIVLWPPDALEKLAVSRTASVPTVAYRKPQLPSRHRMFVAVPLLLVLLMLTAWGAFRFFKRSGANGDRETLLGVKIGDAQQEVVERLRLVKGGPLNPWARKRPPNYLGHVLRVADLGVTEEELPLLDVQRSSDDRVCVVFHEGHVLAVIARRGESGRRLKITDRKSRVLDLYPEDPSEDFVMDATVGKETPWRVEVRRYDALGVGFEMHRDNVHSITLYPPKPPPP
jgi:tRNA A-37 threonylcarbamoyl transferase component Bud32